MPKQDEEEARELFDRREAGLLPKIDIVGSSFFVDWRLRELREVNAPWNIINLRYLECTETGEAYLCIYDREERQGYNTYDDVIIADPENLVLLEIPHEVILDPYAVAREHDYEPAEFIRHNPIASDLKASIHSLAFQYPSAQNSTVRAEKPHEIESATENNERNLGRCRRR
jgi:hypothetical protein